jgi:hypothetical protein
MSRNFIGIPINYPPTKEVDMKKIMLKLEDLRVETFEVSPHRHDSSGTVFANADTDGGVHCGNDTLHTECFVTQCTPTCVFAQTCVDNTCPQTCAETCATCDYTCWGTCGQNNTCVDSCNGLCTTGVDTCHATCT